MEQFVGKEHLTWGVEVMQTVRKNITWKLFIGTFRTVTGITTSHSRKISGYDSFLTHEFVYSFLVAQS